MHTVVDRHSKKIWDFWPAYGKKEWIRQLPYAGKDRSCGGVLNLYERFDDSCSGGGWTRIIVEVAPHRCFELRVDQSGKNGGNRENKITVN